MTAIIRIHRQLNNSQKELGDPVWSQLPQPVDYYYYYYYLFIHSWIKLYWSGFVFFYIFSNDSDGWGCSRTKCHHAMWYWTRCERRSSLYGFMVSRKYAKTIVQVSIFDNMFRLKYNWLKLKLNALFLCK